MNPTVRAFLAVFAGVATGIILIIAGRALSPYQPAVGNDLSNLPAYTEWLRSLPDQAFGILLAIYLIACLAGGFVTVWMAPPLSFPPSFATGFILLLYNVATVLAFPNPAWMSVASCAGCIAFALLGGWLARRVK
ncbi:MAG: hypothetical protein EPGJADBJ_00920 [Saprospiraceae bacterium]|nr:hypothetical protein [Saprospiraceae bacterium]